MGGSTGDYDVHYFMPQPDSSKFSHLRLDEPGRYIDWPLPLEATAPETTTPMEPTATLPSPTPSTFSSNDNFPIVVGALLTSWPAVATPSVVVIESLAINPPLTLAYLPLELKILCSSLLRQH